MTGAMKMAMMRRTDGGARNAYNGPENYGPENRRDSRGRYAPRNDGGYPDGGSMRMKNDGGWVVKPIEDNYDSQHRGGQMDVDSRFRDRRGREHYDNGRFAPMRSAYDADGTDRMPPVYDTHYRYDGGYRMNGSGDRMIGFYGGEIGADYRMDATHKPHDELAHYRSQKQSGHASSADRPLDRQQAQEWVRKMKHSDGSSGEHWTYDQTHQVMKQRNIDCEPAEFYATMNMLWSDYGAVAKKYGVDNVEFWAELSKSFLMDKDAEANKLMLYYECVVKK